MQEFTVRPFDRSGEKNSLEAAFRIHLPRKTLDNLGLDVGDPCSIGGSNGVPNLAYAWVDAKANANSSNPHVKVTDFLKEKYGLSLQDKVTVEKCKDIRVRAEVIYIEPYGSRRGSLLEDFIKLEHAKFGILADLYALPAVCPDGIFDVASKLKKRKRTLKVTKIEPPTGPNVLYHADPDTKIVFEEDPNGTGISTAIAQPPTTATTVPTALNFERIGGLEAQLKTLSESISRMVSTNRMRKNTKYPSFYQRGGGILLYGPEGTGKSSIIQSIGKSFDSNVFEVSPDTLGATAKEARGKLKEIFAKAEEQQPSLITIDHFELVFGDAETARKDLIAGLAVQLRNLQGAGTVVLAAAQSLQAVDKSLRSFDTFGQIIEIPVPDASTRAAILAKTLETRLQDDLCRKIGDRTHGYVGRDLVELCIKAIRKVEQRLDASFIDDRTEKVNGVPETTPSTSECFETENESNITDQLQEEDFASGLVEVRPSAMKEVFLETPKVHWTDIGGAEEVKDAMYKVTVRPYKYPSLIRSLDMKPQKGILLYGPPGCSKTLTAQAIATESSLPFLAVKGAELLNMYVGESERAIREVFRKARAASPSVIFFDEIDSIAASTRGGAGHTSGLNVVTTLLNEMDGIETMGNVLVIAATNAPEVLDPALMRPGRIDSILYVGPPKLQARKEIFQIRNRKRPVAEDVNFDTLADTTDGYSGAEVARICDVAVEEAATEWERGDQLSNPVVSHRHFEAALQQVRKQITEEMRKRYEAWKPGGVSKLL